MTVFRDPLYPLGIDTLNEGSPIEINKTYDFHPWFNIFSCDDCHKQLWFGGMYRPKNGGPDDALCEECARDRPDGGEAADDSFGVFGSAESTGCSAGDGGNGRISTSEISSSGAKVATGSIPESNVTVPGAVFAATGSAARVICVTCVT